MRSRNVRVSQLYLYDLEDTMDQQRKRIADLETKLAAAERDAGRLIDAARNVTEAHWMEYTHMQMRAEIRKLEAATRAAAINHRGSGDSTEGDGQ